MHAHRPGAGGDDDAAGEAQDRSATRRSQIGKWHLGQHHPGQLPINRGFDHHFGYLGGAEDHYTNENGGCGECGKKTDLWRDRGPATGEAGGEFAAYKYDREALRVISTHDGATPLFMYYALQCAHAPNEPDA